MLEATTISPDTALSVGVGVLIALAGAMWKLASMLSDIRAEVRHNGGGSLKDRITAIGLTVEEIRTNTNQNREAINRLDGRVTDHRRRSDATILMLREHIDKRIDKLTNGLTVDDAIRSIRHELGTIPDEDPT